MISQPYLELDFPGGLMVKNPPEMQGIVLPAILIPACVSSSPVFLMMYSAYKLNKQGDNI